MEFPLPKGYQRMGAFPLDPTTLFTTLAELTDYALNSGAAYAGQLCSVSDTTAGTVVVYKINLDKTVSPVDSGIVNLDQGTF